MKSPLVTIAIASMAVGTLMWVSDSLAAFPTTQLGNQPIVPTAITQEVTPQAEYGNLILPDQTYSSSGVITLPIIPATGGEVSISTLFENPWAIVTLAAIMFGIIGIVIGLMATQKKKK